MVKTNFPDVDSASDLAKYIDAIAEAGITKGNTNGTFGFGDNLKRGDFSAMVYRAENLKVAPAVEGVAAKNTTQVELTGTGLAQFSERRHFNQRQYR